MKTSMILTLLATMAITFTGCGGGGGSSSSSKLVASSPSSTSPRVRPTVIPSATPTVRPTIIPSATPTVRPTVIPRANSSYTTLQDLEYKTLTLREYWHRIQDETKNKTYSRMIFKQRYSEGKLIDEQSTIRAIRICDVLDSGKYKYLCMRFYMNADNSIRAEEAHIFNISDDNRVTGNFAFSSTADTTELGRLLSSRETTHAWITGIATTTKNKTTSHLTNEANKEKLSLIKSTSTFNKSTTLTEQEEYLTNLLTDMEASLSN